MSQLQIGANLAARRRARGLTQEQLAARLGVSAPAVSKWETNSSYPDITLLCPLARALGTNVDTLLQFEETLSAQELAGRIDAVVQTARGEGAQAGEAALTALLRAFPNSATLRLHAAAVWDVFCLLFPDAGEAEQARWRGEKKALLESARAAGDAACAQAAALQLALLAIRERETDRAEALLRGLPEQTLDPTMAWSQLYLERGEPQEAARALQRRLYALITQALSLLVQLANTWVREDSERALHVCDVYGALCEAFGMTDMGDGLRVEIHLRAGRIEEAAACLERYVETALGPARLPDARIFSLWLGAPKPGRDALPEEMRSALLKGLEEDAQYAALRAHPRAAAAMERLRGGAKRG